MWGNAAAEGNSLALQGLFLRLAALRVEGNSLRRCGASSLAREPGGRIAGVARKDNDLSAEKFPLLHGSFNTWLPRGGRVGRVLPAVVADTAKAEGVAFHTHRDSPCYRMASPYVGTAGFSCNAAVALRRKATPSHYKVCFFVLLRCGGGQLPQSRACGARQLPREGAFCRIAGIARGDKIYRPRKIPYYMDFSVHGSLARELPRG